MSVSHVKFSTTENIAWRFSRWSVVKAIVRPASSTMAKVMILELALVHVNYAVYRRKKLGATIIIIIDVVIISGNVSPRGEQGRYTATLEANKS